MLLQFSQGDAVRGVELAAGVLRDVAVPLAIVAVPLPGWCLGRSRKRVSSSVSLLPALVSAPSQRTKRHRLRRAFRSLSAADVYNRTDKL